MRRRARSHSKNRLIHNAAGLPPLPRFYMPKQFFNFSLFLFALYAHAGTFITYVSLFFAARGMTAPQIGVLVSLVQVMRIFGPNLWGWVADHTQQRVMVLRLTALCACLAFIGIFFGHTFAWFFVVMVVLNLFNSALTPMSEALMLSEMKGDLSYYGRIRLWGSIGFIVAVMIASYGLEWLGVEAFPWITGAMLLCVLAASFRISEAPRTVSAQPAPPLGPVLRQPEVIAFFASTALAVAAHTSLYVFYSLYLQRLGYSKPVTGAMWSLGVTAEVVFFYFQATVFRRFNPRSIILAAFGIAALRFMMIGAGAGSLAVLVAAQLLHAASFAAHHSASIMAMQRWFAGPLQARGQALFISIAYGVGGTAGGLFMAACWDKVAPEAVYYAAAGLSLAGALAAAMSFRWQAAKAVN
ncbi:MAG: MFS transporter [Telluria sp.]